MALHRHGIGFRPGRVIEEVQVATKEIVFADGGSERFDFPIAVPPHQPPPAVASNGPGVWAIGDSSSTTLPRRSPSMEPSRKLHLKKQADERAWL
ncbi:hypothetical protein ACIQMJ_26370 [Actinosynnema sp. NPDC091369]